MPTLPVSCKHELLTAKLRRELKMRTFPENRFPTVKFLMEHYNVSQATLTRAMAPLFEEGLLYSVAGKGTFVRDKAAMPVQNSKYVARLVQWRLKRL